MYTKAPIQMVLKQTDMQTDIFQQIRESNLPDSILFGFQSRITMAWSP